MRIQSNPMRRRDGSALFTVMLLVMVISSLLGIAYKVSVQRVFMTRKLADRVRAVALAEAGANKAYSILQTNFAARASDTAFPLTSFGGGTFDVKVTPVGSDVAVVASLGKFGYAQELVVLDVRDYGSNSNTPASSVALNYSILCGGTFDFAGCGILGTTNGLGMVHANGAMNIKGNATANLDIRSSTSIDLSNNVNIGGKVTGPVLSYNASKVNASGGFFVQAVPLVTIPNIDFTPYYTYALSKGEVKAGGWSPSGTYTPNGGVVWVSGDLNMSGGTVNGSIYVTGNVKLTSSSTVIAGSSGVAIASRDGDIDVSGQAQTTGLVYAKTGSFSQTGGGNMNGQLIIKGNIKKGGNSDQMLYVKTILTVPGSVDTSDHIIDVSAWQK